MRQLRLLLLLLPSPIRGWSRNDRRQLAVGASNGRSPRRGSVDGRRRRDTWRYKIGGRVFTRSVEKHGGSLIRYGERLAGGERGESRSSEAERSAVIGVSRGELVTCAN